jgi:hypothetical protein
MRGDIIKTMHRAFAGCVIDADTGIIGRVLATRTA